MSCSDNSPPQKRIRATSPATLLEIFVHGDIWMEDGNFVLRALPTEEKLTLAFKVHKSVLAAHATFFRDLFGGPQDALEAASERYEGLPVMDTQDTEEDLHDFLHALYFPAYTNRHRLLDEFELARSDFPGMYRGILELSQKYDARDLRKVIASAICEQWPPQLWRWDDRDAVIRKSLKSLKDPRKDVTRFYPNPAQTIHLGMKYNIPSILPLAFYDLSRVHEFDTDGTTHRRVSDLETLDADDFKRFIRGRASLRTRLFSLDPKQGRSGVCKRTSRDSTVCVDQAESFWTKRFAQIHRSSDPLDLLNLSVLPGETLNLCDGCRPVFAAAAEQRRQRLWEELPDFFNLRGLVGNDWGKVQV